MRLLLPALAMGLLAALTASSPASSAVFHSRESALRLAFPAADNVVAKDLILSGPEARRVRELSGQKAESRLVTAYAGYERGRLIGWAFIDTHNVRSLPETVMLVITPDGDILGTHLLAFHEPAEYMLPAPWFDQLAGERLDAGLSLRGRVDAVSGSTMSAQAVTASVRRLLAVWDVKLSGREASPDPGLLP